MLDEQDRKKFALYFLILYLIQLDSTNIYWVSCYVLKEWKKVSKTLFSHQRHLYTFEEADASSYYKQQNEMNGVHLDLGEKNNVNI